MSITNFNPGPWTADSALPLARRDAGVMVRARSCTIAEVIPQVTARANAHLIAAAPDLYTVLDAFLSDYEERGEVDYKLRQRAQAVLDKAVGR